MNECMFSGAAADSAEHVIPKWLQRRFSLWNQSVILPNGTTSPYRQVKVPVKTEHNSAFSVIEASIAQDNFSPEAAYLWALKLHIGFIYRDARLKLSRTVQESPTILKVGDFTAEISLFRQLYALWRDGGRTQPAPIGSVFILDSLLEPTDFDFFHCLVTGTVGINLGRKFVVVFLWDQGDARGSNLLEQWETHHRKSVLRAPPEEKWHMAYMAHHVWASEGAYWLWRHRRPFSFVQVDKLLALTPPLLRPEGKPLDKKTYGIICRSFGLRLEVFNGPAKNIYSFCLPDRKKSAVEIKERGRLDELGE